MNAQKKEVIKSYILDERLSPEERLERFEGLKLLGTFTKILMTFLGNWL